MKYKLPRNDMSRGRLAILIGGLAAAVLAPLRPAAAQATTEHPLPRGLEIAQQETEAQLLVLSKHQAPVGPAAAHVLDLYRRHAVRERAFILPPLTLLPYLAEGKIDPGMAWALPMLARTRAEKEAIFAEHTQIADALNALAQAGAKAHDLSTKEFAESALADDLGDLEVLEPTLALIEETLHARLPAAH